VFRKVGIELTGHHLIWAQEIVVFIDKFQLQLLWVVSLYGYFFFSRYKEKCFAVKEKLKLNNVVKIINIYKEKFG